MSQIDITTIALSFIGVLVGQMGIIWFLYRINNRLRGRD